jgi:hypothetical protein
MKKPILCFLATIQVLAATSVTASDTPSRYSVFKVDRQQGFVPVKPALLAYLSGQSAKAGMHRLCVIGYDINRQVNSPADNIAWVYWQQGNRLVYWEPVIDGFESKETLIRSRRNLDLTQDVVASDANIAGSTYLISRSWLDDLLTDCKRRGRTYKIKID